MEVNTNIVNSDTNDHSSFVNENNVSENLPNLDVSIPNLDASMYNTNDDLDENQNPQITLKDLRTQNFDRIIIGHLNINSLRHKFEELKSLIIGNLDVFVVSETKINDSFPKDQFKMDGFTHIRNDRDDEGGGFIVYIRSDIPFKIIKNLKPQNIEGIFIELNFRNKKLLLFTGYNPNKPNAPLFLNQVGKHLYN